MCANSLPMDSQLLWGTLILLRHCSDIYLQYLALGIASRKLSRSSWTLALSIDVTDGSRRHHQLPRRRDGGEDRAAEGNELWRRKELLRFSLARRSLNEGC